MNWSETRRRLLELAARRGLRRVGEAIASASDPNDPAAGDLEGSDAGVATAAGPPAGRALLLPRQPERGAGRDPRSARGPEPVDRTGRVGCSVRAHSLCVASGKGGTGKSVTTAALATLLSDRGRTLILDADLGVGNAHILQDVSPPRTCVDVVEGRHSAREVLVKCSGQVDLLAGGSGVPRMAGLSAYEMHLIAAGLEELELEYRHLIVDSAAGVSRQTISFARSSDLTVVVTTPDLTSMTDAYAFIKVLAGRGDRLPLLLVNRARDESQANEVSERIRGVCRRFLGDAPRLVGWVPEDPAVGNCVNRRGSVAQLEPRAPAALALRRVAVALSEELGRHHARGLGQRLLDEVGYPQRLGHGSPHPA